MCVEFSGFGNPVTNKRRPPVMVATEPSWNMSDLKKAENLARLRHETRHTSEGGAGKEADAEVGARRGLFVDTWAEDAAVS